MPRDKRMGKGKSVETKQMTMKEVHRPSSLEGAIWSMGGIRDARIILHSPPGCYMMQHMNALCNEWQTDLFSTSVTYADVMMGTEDALENVLRQAASYQPKAIIIITSGIVPPIYRMFCDDATSLIRQTLKDSLNAKTVGDMYAGDIEHRGVGYYYEKAVSLGEKLV